MRARIFRRSKRRAGANQPFFQAMNYGVANGAFFAPAAVSVQPKLASSQPADKFEREAGAAPPPILRLGAQGSQVEQMQERLNLYGVYLVADGIFGPKTLRAVRRFQADHAPPADGIVGPVTWKALAANSNAQSPGKEEKEASPEDLTPLGTGSLHEKDSARQSEALLQMIFGPILQETNENFIHSAEQMPPATSKLALNAAPPPKKAALQIAQLDLVLKFIVSMDTQYLALNGIRLSQDQIPFYKAILLHSISEYVKAKGLNPLPRQEVDLFLKRVALMRDFYNSFNPNGSFVTTPEFDKQRPISDPHAAERRRIAAFALSDVGRVRAKDKPRRYGGNYLKHIFDVAYKNHNLHPAIFEKYLEGTKCQHGDSLCVKTGQRQHSLPLIKGDLLPSWCGIGALYWLKKTIGTDLNWKRNSSILYDKLKRRPFDEFPKVGDVLISTNFGHHGVVVWIDNNNKKPKNKAEWSKIRVKTVDANVAGGSVQGGKIMYAPAGPGRGVCGYFDLGAFNPFERK